MVEHNKHFAETVENISLTLLMSYREQGIQSRLVMLIEHKQILDNIISNKEYKDYSKSDLELIECYFYIEVIERIFLLMEDFCKVSHALLSDISLFPKNLLITPNVKNMLLKLENRKTWLRLLRYPEADTLKFDKQEIAFLEKHYNSNIDTFISFVKKLKGFYDLYNNLYTQRKHGNAIIYSISKTKLDDNDIFILPVIYNSERPNNAQGIPLSYPMYIKGHIIINTLSLTIQDMISSRVLKNGYCEHFFSRAASFLISYHCFLAFRSRLRVPERVFRARFQFTGHSPPP